MTPERDRLGGRTSSRHSPPFSARYDGVCDRCGWLITVGQEIHFHRDFCPPSTHQRGGLSHSYWFMWL
jgi:hypothetical protein